MRDYQKIDRILGIIRKQWYKNPDLRLMQLLFNHIEHEYPHGTDLYYIEDSKLEEILKKEVEYDKE